MPDLKQIVSTQTERRTPDMHSLSESQQRHQAFGRRSMSIEPISPCIAIPARIIGKCDPARGDNIPRLNASYARVVFAQHPLDMDRIT